MSIIFRIFKGGREAEQPLLWLTGVESWSGLVVDDVAIRTYELTMSIGVFLYLLIGFGL